MNPALPAFLALPAYPSFFRRSASTDPPCLRSCQTRPRMPDAIHRPRCDSTNGQTTWKRNRPGSPHAAIARERPEIAGITVEERHMRTVLVGMAAVLALGAMSAAQTTVPREQPLAIKSMAGADLFKFYCSTCHGEDARGRRAVAPERPAGPDLTILA